MTQTTIINTLAELADFAESFTYALKAKSSQATVAVVIALSGDLGAGKTTLVQLVAKNLLVDEIVTSPTFTIMKAYQTKDETVKRLVHMDAYRIESLNELGPLRLSEIFEAPGTVFCIEWAEKIAQVLPAQTVFVDIQTQGEERHIVVTGL